MNKAEHPNIFQKLYTKIRHLSLFSRRRQRSIVARVLGIMMLWGMVVYLFAIAGIWWGSSRVLEDNFRKQAAEWLQKLDEMGTPLFASQDASQFASVRDQVLRFPELAYLRFYDADNKTIAEYMSDGLDGEKIPGLSSTEFKHLRKLAGSKDPILMQPQNHELSLLVAAAPVVVRKLTSDSLMTLDLSENRHESFNVIGYVELGLDFSSYRDQLLTNIAWGSLFILGLFIIAAIIGRILIKKSLSPLVDLKIPLARLAGGDTSVRVDGNQEADEEIRVIAEALNTTISALQSRDDKLQLLANYDSLTGLINKHSFHHQLQLEVARVREADDCSALFFIDLDRFKHVNDTLGHVAGDRLLAQVADILRNRMREDDVIARFGGDEFTVIARSVNEKDAESIARSIVSSLQDFVFVEGGRSFNIFCSVGVVMIEPEEISIDTLFSNADMACYQAKSQGRNCYYVFDPEEQEALREKADISWSKQISDAIANDHLQLCFQPIMSLAEGGTHLFEVLVRLKKDNGEIVSPNVFLPAAERLGLANEIDYWVIEHAFERLAKLLGQGQKVCFTINLSARVFESAELANNIRKYARRYKINPSFVIFEITEQTAVRHLDRAIRRIQELSGMGYSFALDDFGVGFSSFNYLKRLPVDFLKIDGTFVENLVSDPVDQAMIRSIIQIARTLNKKTIAEYVQDAETLDMLKRYGIDYVQGYYLGEPDQEFDSQKYEAAIKKSRSNVIAMKKNQT